MLPWGSDLEAGTPCVQPGKPHSSLLTVAMHFRAAGAAADETLNTEKHCSVSMTPVQHLVTYQACQRPWGRLPGFSEAARC